MTKHSPEAPRIVLETRDVTKTYVLESIEVNALRGVDVAIHEGEMVSIMGPSGSGKSTLMHIVGLLDRPTSGQVILEGEDVSQLMPNELAALRNRHIGFVFQSFNLLPRSTVMRNVVMPMLYTRVPRDEREDRAAAALAAVGLEESLWTHRSNELSGGQMQRVAIARALVNDPSLILADEPTGNLDTATGDSVMDLFARLNADGRTIVLITHEPEIATKTRRVVRIQDGLVVEDAAAIDAHVRQYGNGVAAPSATPPIISGSDAPSFAGGGADALQ